MIRSALTATVVLLLATDASAVLPVRPLVGTALTKANIAGIYLGTLTLPGAPLYRAEIQIFADGTYRFRDENAQQRMPAPGCTGRWRLTTAGRFTGTLRCAAIGVVRQAIHLRGVTLQALKGRAGAAVTVVSSFYQNQPMPFNLRRVTKVVFK